ncbi:phage head closure protein [Paraburkholderia phymatum]|uniref:Phage head-tail adaptor n=1 Tax=Paraburkholderia phymatum (strain DSM 17167 / CIP 108236 / LMG 21445 / STM815) TaxID=391038 RepID=B2JL17_PARP8|nr:phage head closure protein [Paraburkholderia phymatum]ACC72546.1 phage head-tail adaptor [Paraburkholderia phymatum STM815]
MQAGRLRYRLTFEKPVRLLDETGEVIVDQWVKAFTVWGSLEPLSGREYLSASEFRAGITTRVRVRWRSDLDPAMRIRCDEVTYDIAAILPVMGLHKEAQIMCQSGVVTTGGQP